MQYRQAYLESLQNFAAKDPSFMAEAAGGSYKTEERKIEFLYLGRLCLVIHPEGGITVDGWPAPSHEEQIIILQYLAGASSLPLRNQWLSFLQLPGGPHHFAPFQKEAIFPLARKFGPQPEMFRQAAGFLGGVPTTLGHVGMIIPVFPLVPLGIILWTGDEEFAPSANILFDSSVQTHLSTSALYMMGIAVAQRLLHYPEHPDRNWYSTAVSG
ncbi:MAG: DUF3786 domain-containing protein [Dethiobacter sp.]|jgi:hypothetical protein|nr:DUF3786 domain-containing protein [Dethiobacter sp.]